MPKAVKSFRFDMSTLEEMDFLTEEYGLKNHTQLIEYLIEQACGRIRHGKLKNTNPADLAELLTQNGFRLENKNNVLWLNDKISHYGVAKYPIHAKLHELGFQQVEKLFKEVIEYLIPGYLKKHGIK